MEAEASYAAFRETFREQDICGFGLTVAGPFIVGGAVAETIVLAAEGRDLVAVAGHVDDTR